jgi:hypothetical protein
MMAQPLPAGVVVKPVPAGGCEVNVQMTLVVAFLASLGSVAVHLIKLKFNSLEILESTLEEHAVLREELASTANIVRRDEIDDYFSEENEKHHAMLAFKDKFTGKTKCDMWQASTFHDEYFKTKRGHLRYWFVCMAGGKEGPCMTVILSKKWDRKFADPGASKNWYKCTFCNASYKTGWGGSWRLHLMERSIVTAPRCPTKTRSISRPWTASASTKTRPLHRRLMMRSR